MTVCADCFRREPGLVPAASAAHDGTMSALRDFGLAVFMAASCASGFAADAPQEEVITFPAPKGVSVYFSPRGGCEAAVIHELDRACDSIFVQAYSLTSTPIAMALVEAHRRGVKVSVLLDTTQRNGNYSHATFLQNAGIETRIDDRHSRAHNKLMVIDEETVITGSFNFTKEAEDRNAENLVIIWGKELAEAYVKNWESHRDHSEVYARRVGR